MDPHRITLYGIPNCDTVKKARAWLGAQGLDFQFHDFKKQGVPEQRLDGWIKTLGWQALVNTRGTTWRRLDDAARAGVTDGASARTLMLAQPSVIKRPVMEWADAGVSVGFDETAWRARVA
ncbi:ArsC family reductase [Rhodoferax sp. UBA5149]|uniref:ArsC family reductase n=1 Tax=Rhodoferax sp. UBA5149 TaxID=1947379 RepID=UPI0025CCD60B|nr:ArsC family reductase [Rhodoferax sp. UBA5149]